MITKLPLDINSPQVFDLELMMLQIENGELNKILLKGLSEDQKTELLFKEVGRLASIPQIQKLLPQA